MRYLVLATDYDGTIAHHGLVNGDTLSALERLLASGRKLVLVTGRQLEELQAIFPHLELFEWIVAENGALLYRPSTRQTKQIAPPPSEAFVQRLRKRGVGPISVGHSIVATWEPHETVVLETIRDLGLELQVIFNKGAVMVLPASVNKASGLRAALKEMGLSPHNAVGVGDAENDHAFLAICECAAAVANALPVLKERVDIVTSADHGAGVTQLIAEMVASDLIHRQDRLTRHHLLLGNRAGGGEVALRPFGTSVLIAGPSASGKSSAAAALMERLAEKAYQFCVIDPEGDYSELEGAVHLGNREHWPPVEEILEVLRTPKMNAVVNLLGLPLADRPPFFHKLLPRLEEMRTKFGRPHWIIIDEVHHLLPASWAAAAQDVPYLRDRVLLITVHPDEVAPAVLASINTLLVVGQPASDTLARFCKVVGEDAPPLPDEELQPGEVFLWRRDDKAPPYRVKILPARAERHRHSRKYAEGELPPERSFYFRGPDLKLNLRAQNLCLFLQIADGVDDGTWVHHLRQEDYSRWIGEKVKDDVLAAECREIERDRPISAKDSRARIRAAVEKYYTLPASCPKT